MIREAYNNWESLATEELTHFKLILKVLMTLILYDLFNEKCSALNFLRKITI